MWFLLKLCQFEPESDKHSQEEWADQSEPPSQAGRFTEVILYFIILLNFRCDVITVSFLTAIPYVH